MAESNTATQHATSAVADASPAVDTQAQKAVIDQNTASQSAQQIAAAQNPISNPTGKASDAKPEVKPAETQAAKAAEAARKYKLKVDGRDEEYSEADVLRLAQLGKASDKRFQEAAQMRKQSEEFINLLKSPEGLKQIAKNPAVNLDLRKFAEDLLVEEMKKEALTPEQRQIAELQAQLQKYNDDQKANEAKAAADERQKLEDHYAQDFDKKITQVITTSGLPKTPETVKRMVKYMSNALSQGIDIEPENVVELVRQDYMRVISDLFGQTDGDTLLKLMGDGLANKIRKTDLAKLRASQQPLVNAPAPEKPTAPGPTSSNVINEKKPLNIHQWRDELNKRNGR